MKESYFLRDENVSDSRASLFVWLMSSSVSTRFTVEVRNDFVVRVGFGDNPESFDDFVEWLLRSDIPHEHLDPQVVGFLGVDVVVG